MKIKQLVENWGSPEKPTLHKEAYSICLPVHEAARIRALAELYPNRNETQIIGDLLRTALDEVEASFPYVQGKTVLREDEYGDPVYSDDGLTPQYYELKKKYSQQMLENTASSE